MYSLGYSILEKKPVHMTVGEDFGCKKRRKKERENKRKEKSQRACYADLLSFSSNDGEDSQDYSVNYRLTN